MDDAEALELLLNLKNKQFVKEHTIVSNMDIMKIPEKKDEQKLDSEQIKQLVQKSPKLQAVYDTLKRMWYEERKKQLDAVLHEKRKKTNLDLQHSETTERVKLEKEYQCL